MTTGTQVHRDSNGEINGPAVHLPGKPDRTFVGEVHELIRDLDVVVSTHGASEEMERDLRRILDAAIGVGFDYGTAYGQSGAGAGATR